MTEQNVDNLVINYLTEEQYQEARDNGEIYSNQLYMTPDTPDSSDKSPGSKLKELDGTVNPVELYYLDSGSYVVRGSYAVSIDMGQVTCDAFDTKVVDIETYRGFPTNGDDNGTYYKKIIIRANTDGANNSDIHDQQKTYYINATTYGIIKIDTLDSSLLNSNSIGMLQPKIDNTLETSNKIVSAAINELNGHYKYDLYPKNEYSTNEIKLGFWIDGKPVYQKVVDVASLGNASNVYIDHNIDMDTPISICGICYNKSDNNPVFTIPMGNVFLWLDPNQIVISSASDRTNLKAKVIIRYTKN